MHQHELCPSLLQTLRAAWRQLNAAIARSINEMENQILIRDQLGLTEDQLREYRASFNHFDRDHSGQLDKNEFRSCLLSLGYSLGADPVRYCTPLSSHT